MKKGSVTKRAQTGAISAALVATTGLAGFAAGATLVAMLALDRSVIPAAAGSDPGADSNANLHHPPTAAFAPKTDWPAAQPQVPGWTPEPALMGP